MLQVDVGKRKTRKRESNLLYCVPWWCSYGQRACILDDLSSNPAGVFSFYSEQCLTRSKINEKEARDGQFFYLRLMFHCLLHRAKYVRKQRFNKDTKVLTYVLEIFHLQLVDLTFFVFYFLSFDLVLCECLSKKTVQGRQPWSSCYGRRLMF